MRHAIGKSNLPLPPAGRLWLFTKRDVTRDHNVHHSLVVHDAKLVTVNVKRISASHRMPFVHEHGDAVFEYEESNKWNESWDALFFVTNLRRSFPIRVLICLPLRRAAQFWTDFYDG